MLGWRYLGLFAWLILTALSPTSPIVEGAIDSIIYALLLLSPLLAALLAFWGLIRLSTTVGGRPLTCAWLALIALLVLFEATGAWGWDLPAFTLTILSLPATVWGCLSKPVRGRPLLGFSLGFLNYLAFPASFWLTADLIGGLLRGRLPHGWTLLGVTLLTAFSAPYALGAALIASWGEGRAGGERAVLGFALAFASWFLTITLTFFIG